MAARGRRVVEEATRTVHQSASRRLWDDLGRVRRKWLECGRFPLHELGVGLGSERSTLTSPDSSWTLTI